MPRKIAKPYIEGEHRPLSEKPPRGLGKYGRAFWREFAPAAAQAGAMEGDGAAFQSAAEHYELAQLAWREIQVQGLFGTDEQGVRRRNPACIVHRDSWAACVKVLATFGLTPKGRAFERADDTPSLQDILGLSADQAFDDAQREGDEWGA